MECPHRPPRHHTSASGNYFPLLPGIELGEPPLLPAPLPPAPLRLVPLEPLEEPLEPAGPQFIALLPPLAILGLLLDEELLLGELLGRLAALLPLVPLLLELELLGLLLALPPGRQSLLLAPERTDPLVPLGLDELGLEELGLDAPLPPLAPLEPPLLDWASACPPSSTTAAPTMA